MMHKPKVKQSLRIANDFLDIKTTDTNTVIQQLEENMRIREMPLEKQIQARGLLRRH
jgi:hypothetical protein